MALEIKAILVLLTADIRNVTSMAALQPIHKQGLCFTCQRWKIGRCVTHCVQVESGYCTERMTAERITE